MTKETAAFLLGIVNGLTLNVGADDFDRVVPQILAARAELTDILAA